MKFPRVYDLDMNPKAVLENATDIKAEIPKDKLGSGSFILPFSDQKNKECKPLYRVRIFDDSDEEVGLFRIMKTTLTKKSGEKKIEYKLEHVLGTLHDTALPGLHEREDKSTRNNIEFLLDRQNKKLWELRKCDLDRKFKYKWENESSLYDALEDIFDPIDNDYIIDFDTSELPWKLDIVKPSDEPKARIRAGYNLQSITKKEDASKVVTRVRGLGYGEGDNQLDTGWISASQKYIDKYGDIEHIISDRKYEHMESLTAAVTKYLHEHVNPEVTYEIEAADVYPLTGLSLDKFERGDLVRVYDEDLDETFDIRLEKNAQENIGGDMQIGEAGTESEG